MIGAPAIYSIGYRMILAGEGTTPIAYNGAWTGGINNQYIIGFEIWVTPATDDTNGALASFNDKITIQASSSSSIATTTRVVTIGGLGHDTITIDYQQANLSYNDITVCGDDCNGILCFYL